jgi:hypothetical protein
MRVGCSGVKHRATDADAAAVPRLRFVLALAACVCLVLAALGRLGWRAYERDQAADRLRTAQHQLDLLHAPPGLIEGNMPLLSHGTAIVDFPAMCKPDRSTRCFHSTNLPHDACRDAAALLDNPKSDCGDSYLGVDRMVQGQVHGSRAVVLVSPHLYWSKDGRYPDGAMRGRGPEYFLGSDILLKLASEPR